MKEDISLEDKMRKDLKTCPKIFQRQSGKELWMKPLPVFKYFPTGIASDIVLSRRSLNGDQTRSGLIISPIFF